MTSIPINQLRSLLAKEKTEVANLGEPLLHNKMSKMEMEKIWNKIAAAKLKRKKLEEEEEMQKNSVDTNLNILATESANLIPDTPTETSFTSETKNDETFVESTIEKDVATVLSSKRKLNSFGFYMFSFWFSIILAITCYSIWYFFWK